MISAHRGASGYAPENTMSAFRLAHELGADGVEFDVHLSADDRLVVIHDDTLDRTTNGRGYVRDHPWSALARLDTGSGERIPLLEEVLDWARRVEMPLSIEMKRPNAALGRLPYPDLARRIIEMVRAFDLTDQVLVFSDDHALVRKARQIDPSIATAVVLGLGTFIDPVGLAKEAGADGAALYWRYLSVALVDAFHAADMHVFGFGVGEDPATDSQGLAAMLRNGTDFVSSGQPDRLRAFVDAWFAHPGVSEHLLRSAGDSPT
jgi:glycerophosphoryl diester phosphodiesterase